VIALRRRLRENGGLTRAVRHVVDGAVLLEWPGRTEREANAEAVAIAFALAAEPPPGFLEAIPGARTLLVLFDPASLPHERAEELVLGIAPREKRTEPRTITLRTAYGGEHGPDLASLAARAGMPVDDLVRAHAAADHRVAFLGFAPGFAYLTGAPAALAVPRLATPRVRVPAGSVAVADGYTGIYPAELPGGWHLIGRVATRMFDPAASPPSLLLPGDRVVFESAADLVLASEDSNEANPPDVSDPAARVMNPGPWTSVQGTPRFGLAAMGVPRGGAMDLAALGAANAALGNAPLAPQLEITVAGPELELLAPARLAVAGDIECAPAGAWPRSLRAGDRLKFGRVRAGARAYLAIDGGFMDPAAAIVSRRLRRGDLLGRARTAPPCGRIRPPARGMESLDRRMKGLDTLARMLDPIVVRAIPGPHLGWFSTAGIETFFTAEYVVSSRSDRRGSRLEGPRVELARPADLPPEGVTPGAVQVPGDGMPIALGPDGPVTGGYPRVASIIGADLPRLAQARPGQRIRFERATLADALAARRT
jgi:KipI family sensor histidine kinase inhibitor